MKFLLLILLQFCLTANAQFAYNNYSPPHFDAPAINGQAPIIAGRKLYQRNTGMILGLQRGKYPSIEMGGEAHWRKISLLKPHITGATVNLEYNFEENVLGYKAGMWMKSGHINLTYGANVSYYTNFKEGHRFGVGPAVGFRLAGFHLINGFNILTNDKRLEGGTPVEVNTLYMSLRYYFPVQNKFTWDRKTMKKKKEKRKAREARKKERLKKRAHGEGGILNIFKKKDSRQ